MAHQFAEINGTKIHFDVAAPLNGEGTAVTFIHAGIADLTMWEPQVDAFVAAGYRVIRYDLRGWGQTERPSGEFSDVADLYGLLQHLGVEQTAVVGCSFGGKTAVDFAISHPEMVRALVLVGAAVGGFDWSSVEFDPREQAVEEAYDRGELELSAELDTQVWFDGPNRTSNDVDAEVRRQVYEMVLWQHELPEPQESKRIELEPLAIERLGEISAPTLVMVGQEDQSYIDQIGDVLCAGIDGASKVMMADTAHLPNMEKPDAFNRIVLDFLEAVYGG